MNAASLFFPIFFSPQENFMLMNIPFKFYI